MSRERGIIDSLPHHFVAGPSAVDNNVDLSLEVPVYVQALSCRWRPCAILINILIDHSVQTDITVFGDMHLQGAQIGASLETKLLWRRISAIDKTSVESTIDYFIIIHSFL